jgi:2-haloacid dehalogenase
MNLAAVVFDLGGVLIDWDPDHLYRVLIPDPARRHEFLSTTCMSTWIHRLETGAHPQEVVAELVTRYPDHEQLIHAWWERWTEMLGHEIPGTRLMVEHLRQARVPTYALTNWSQHTWPRAVERHPFLTQLFDGIVLSGNEGVTKPSSEIFRILTVRYDLDPSTTGFVDDTGANVAAAQALGFRTHQFSTASGLRHWLATSGLRV